MPRRRFAVKHSLLALLTLFVAAGVAWAAQPTAYNQQYDYSDWTTSFPDTPHSGTRLDADFGAVETTLDDILENLELIQRDDGDLANQSVGLDQLTAGLLASLGEITIWATSTAYAVGDYVATAGAVYYCETAHTSGTFATDLAAAKWTLVLDMTGAVHTGTSTTSLAIATGSKAFTTQASKAWATGQRLRAASDDGTKVMEGEITAYSSTSLTLDVDFTEGSGTHADWNISTAGPVGQAVDINALTAETTLAGGSDYIPFYDTDEGAENKMLLNTFYKTVNDLTEDTAPHISNDFIPLYDASATSGKKFTFATIYKLINDLTEDTAPHVSNDFIPTYDASATAGKKISITSLFKKVNDLTEDTAPDRTADFVAAYDASGSTPSKIKISNLRAGAILQRAYSEYIANANLTTTIPLDDTIPQNTEGTEILTATITPTTATSRIRVRFQGWGAISISNDGMGVALFIDSTADALAASAIVVPTANYRLPLNLEFEHVPGDTSEHTYKIRVGPHSAATMRMNGSSSARIFGGVSRATLIVEEVVP